MQPGWNLSCKEIGDALGENRGRSPIVDPAAQTGGSQPHPRKP